MYQLSNTRLITQIRHGMHVSTGKAKGIRAERQLANKFWSLGFAVMRGGSSGGGVRKRFVPDLVVMKNGKIIVLEVKYRSEETTIPLERDRLERLLEFAHRAGGSAYVAVKYGRKQWRFIPASALLAESSTDSTYVYIRPELVEKSGLTLRQLVERELSKHILSTLSANNPE